MYNIEHLRMFSQAARLGSFTECAKSLGKAQSAVSQGIANLEIDMNCQLFDRSSKKPTVTGSGKRLLAYAEAVLAQMDELKSAVDAMGVGTELNLVMVYDAALLVPALPHILKAFSRAFPATSIELKVMKSSLIAQEVESKKADIGLMFCDVHFPREVGLCYLGSVEFVAIAACEHPLAALTSVEIRDLIAQRQLMFIDEGNGQQPLPPISAAQWQLDSFDAVIDLVSQGVGWGYVPKHMILTAAVKILPIEFDHKPWMIPVDRVTQKGQVQGQALNWMCEKLLNVYSE